MMPPRQRTLQDAATPGTEAGPRAGPARDAAQAAPQALVGRPADPASSAGSVGSADLVVPLSSVRRSDVGRVGGKCANLGELIAAGIDVPAGFAVAAAAFARFLDVTELRAAVTNALAPLQVQAGARASPEAFEHASKQIRAAIEAARMPDELATPIRDAYLALCQDAPTPDVDNGWGDPGAVPVAVRSSATGEDLPEASFAGQQDTYLNVLGADAVVERVKACWASLYTPRALFYRAEKGFGNDGAAIAVAVQRMVASDSAGVCFTLDPVTGDDTHLVIESTWGLGEALVSGRVAPDRFVVDRKTLAILERDIACKTLEHVPRPDRGLTTEQQVHPSRQNAPSLTDEEVSRLAETALRIERHFGAPQDVEFAVEFVRDLRRIRIVQARPETVHSRKRNGHGQGSAATAAAAVSHPVMQVPATPAPTQPAGQPERKVATKGKAASPGLVVATARIVRTPQDAAAKLRQGDILVTHMTNPDWVPYMRIAGAIVTDDGGVTCHAAIVSREMGVPCIVGTRNGTKALMDGQVYTVDAKTGVVYEGSLGSGASDIRGAPSGNPAQVGSEATAPLAGRTTAISGPVAGAVTSTKVYVNLSMPDLAEKVARETGADGVGLLRAEHLMLSVGKHPRLLMEEGGAQAMVDAFAEGIRKVAAPFSPRPVVYRFLDFKPDEYLNMPGGERFERDTGHVGPNPLIGYRGCFRYTKEPDIFRLECQAIRKVRDEHNLTNVHVMLPFVRTLSEFRAAKRIMEEEGLVRNRSFKLWMMVEVPSTVLTIDRFIEDGLDGVSFGTNDLTMLVLGIDRDDAMVQEIYDERNPAVLRAIGMVIEACNAAGVTTSVCGQAPSNHPEVVEFLVRQGATSMSVNPDKVEETRTLVAGLERKVILEGVRGLGSMPQRPAPGAASHGRGARRWLA